MKDPHKGSRNRSGFLGIRRIYSLAAIITLCVLLLSSASAHAWFGKVVAVKDGDTIEVLHDGRAETIRLYGIDAPEKAQDFGNKAKQTLSDLVFGKVVEIKNMDTDRYGRTVALVSVGMKSANEAMIAAGMAWVFERYCHKAFCNGWQSVQERAKSKKIGLWSHAKPIPPWEWRHKGKGSQPALTRGIRK